MVALVNYNLTILLQVWRERKDGHLRLTPTERLSPVSQLVTVSGGGIVDKTMWAVLVEGLDTHVYSLVERARGGSEPRGDRKLMAALIVQAARRHEVDQGEVLAAERVGSDPFTPPQMLLTPAITLPPFQLSLEQTGAEDVGPAVTLRAHGRELLAAGQFARADELLSAARNLRMDHAPTLAMLAIARLQNPERPPSERRRDAESMAKMAWLLAPEHSDVKWACKLILSATPRVVDERPSLSVVS